MILSKFELKDKVAIVTGAGKGIGKGIAVGLAEAGTDVVVVARTREDVEATALEIGKLGRKAKALSIDVREAPQVQEMIDSTIAEFGKIDILINNVGVSLPDTPFIEISEKKWDALIRINLKTCFLCTQAVLKHMITCKSGSIVNISSGAGIVGAAGHSAYSAAKAGVINLTESLASELAQFNIRVNCIAPGTIAATTWFVDQMPEEQAKIFMDAVAIKRFGKPEDVALATIFLASDASSWITGRTLQVDGGYRPIHQRV